MKRRTLLQEHPETSTKWHPTLNGNKTPDDVTSGSHYKAYWICDKGHTYQRSVYQELNTHTCPVCTNHQVLEGYNDLMSTYPEIAAQWNYERNGDLLPTHVVAGSGRKVWWICDKGHEWEAIISDRTAKGHGCHYCSGQKPIRGENDLASQHSDIAALWHPTMNGNLKPESVTRTSNRRVWWACENGYDEHSYQRTVYHEIEAEGHCPYCANKRVLPGFNDLQHCYP